MLWLTGQFRRLNKFFHLIPIMAAELGGIFAVFRQLAKQTLFFGIDGLRTFCRPYLREYEAFQFQKTGESKVLVRDASLAHAEEMMSLTEAREFEKKTGRNSGYIVWAPGYVSFSAGIWCLYNLCHELNAAGYPSFITGSSESAPEGVRAPLLSLPVALDFVKRGYIVVYPETVMANPLASSKVVRWVLNRPGYLGGAEIYHPDEMIFYYSEIYRASIKNATASKLYMPTIDEEIFFDDGRPSHERNLECYYVGKATWKEGYFDPRDVFEITRSAPAKKELGKLFRNSKLLYSFDNSTILVYEAILCGCPVVIIPDGTLSKTDVEKSELGMGGLAWGMEDLKNAQAGVALLKERYAQVKLEYRDQLKKFIQLTQALSAKVPQGAALDRLL